MAEFIRKKKVNWAILTPSFIGTLRPDVVPGLQTLVSAGELMSSSLRNAWASEVKLLNAYGLTEVSIFCSAPFAVLLAAFRAAHYCLTGAEDATIGAPNANRNRPELEDIIGFFVNTQCKRITVDASKTFATLVHQVRSTVATALEHQDVPFDRVYLQFFPGQETHLGTQAGMISGHMIFATDLFKTENIRNVAAVFSRILREGLDQSHTPIAALPLTDGTAIADLQGLGLLEIERTEYPRDSSIVDVFRKQVAVPPDAIAVIDSSMQLTYAEADHQSDQVMLWLRLRNMAAETSVGVLSPRSCETVIAILGILKADLAYLPLDVKSPAARLTSILSALPQRKLILVEHDGFNGYLGAVTKEPSATSLAYLIFTSGSTGKPKGCMVEHRAIVRLVVGTSNSSPASRIAHIANIAFDAATWEIWAALLNGGTLVCVDYMTTLNSHDLGVVFAQEKVNTALLTPVLLKECLAGNPVMLAQLDNLFIGGDRLDGRDAIAARALVGNCVCNAYGPTENGVISTMYNVPENESFINGVPIGKAIGNSGANGPAVRDVSVVIRKQAGQVEMVGFVVALQIRERLQAFLTAYMIPARIVIISQMPVNANGKVDRKELSRRALEVPKPEAVSATTSAFVSPLDKAESIICEEFTDVLGVNAGIADNFFRLGGHSLMATKLAARISRQLDAYVSVKDIFDYPVPGQLATKLKLASLKSCNGTSDIRTVGNAPFQLLDLVDLRRFVQQEIYPQLEHLCNKVVDVYPATRLQKRYLHYPLTGKPKPLAPFNIGFLVESNLANLAKACKSLVEYFDIFRTVFVPVGGDLYEVP
ncbi:hypothetical protein GGR57DRAFT_501214 [Xylariaceae sp. FL1272]|nr:hypothetical protein GGR57DRAFT_501214 [Xylariaceae sp. FL1272]